MLLTGAEIIIETLKNRGVDTIFGYPGGTAIAVYDALYRRGTGIRHVLTSHEQGAAHAADGYARSTGKTGVCLVTSGPGATNLVTGIATAYMDSVPVVAITVNVSTADLGKDSFQEVDITGITMPVTKHSFIIKDIALLADTLERAFDIASSGRPGPVLVDITKDVTKATYEFANAEDPAAGNAAICKYFSKGNIPGHGYDEDTTLDELKKAINLIVRSEKPVLIVGGGAVNSGAAGRIDTFVKKLELPVVDTLMGKGVFSGRDSHYLGMAGLYGTEAATAALREADLIIAAGMRFSERVTHNSPNFAPKAKIIQIDIDRAELNKNIKVDVAIAGDISAVLEDILNMMKKPTARSFEKRKNWLAELKKMNCSGSQFAATLPSEEAFTGPEIVGTVSRLAPENAIIATEVGLNQMWTAGWYTFTGPRQLLTSGGLGTMGFGLGAAIGAAVGNQGKTVINFAGDGCFRMNMNELLTAVRLELPIIEIIFDNRSLGMVQKMQDMLYGGRHAQTDLSDNADYEAIATALGAKSCTVGSASELETAFTSALGSGGTHVIVCKMK